MPVTVDERQMLLLALRNDLAAFIHRTFQTVCPGARYAPNWHIEAMAHALARCEAGETHRLIITLPPRSLKSISASVAFPAWVLGRDPCARLVCVSYSNELTSKHARDCRSVMLSSWYRQAFPQTVLDKSKMAELDFMTTKKGYRYGTSVGGTLTGRGGNGIIVDDPLKPQEANSKSQRHAVNEWYKSTLYSRLDNKDTGFIIVVMQRLHIDDLVGHVLDLEEWEHLDLPAIAQVAQEIPLGSGRFFRREPDDILHPAQESSAALERIKYNLGSNNFSAQYNQQPVPPGGGMIKWEWFRTYDKLPHNYDVRIVQSWDTASKAGELNDFSVCTTWSMVGGDFYLLDVYRDRLDFPNLKAAAIAQARRYRPHTILVEDMGSGTALVQELRTNRLADVPNPTPIKPQGDKVLRMSAQSATVESGKVYVPSDAPWLVSFKDEFLAFPQGRHDDQIDSVSQFLCWTAHDLPIRSGRIRGIFT